MHGTSRVSSAISVWRNSQNFITGSSHAAIDQWVRRWTIDHRAVQGVGSRPLGDYEFTKPDSAILFVSVLCSAW